MTEKKEDPFYDYTIVEIVLTVKKKITPENLLNWILSAPTNMPVADVSVKTSRLEKTEDRLDKSIVEKMYWPPTGVERNA